MRAFRLQALALTGLLALAAGCQKDNTAFLDELSSFDVEITAGNPGSSDNPLDFTSAGEPFTISIQAVDGHGNPMAWDGTVHVSAVPGQVTPTVASLTGGQASVDLELSFAFGRSRIWVEDDGTLDAPGTFATGVTDAIFFQNPSIRDIQESDTTTTSPFEGQRVDITSGHMVVTNVTHEGFYVTDTDDTEWGSVYAFSFGRPDGLSVGDTLSQLTGTADEFLGFTELGNPFWTVSGSGSAPPPQVLDCAADVQAGGLQMERWEAALVEVSSADIVVCNSFPSCPDYDQYQQWVIELPCGGQMNVVSNYTLPDLDPEANQGQQFSVIRGTLRHVQFASPQWILEPRGAGDVCCPSCSPAMTDGC